MKKSVRSSFLFQALQDTRKILGEMSSTLRELHTLSRGLKSKLGKMNQYYKEAHTFCLAKRHVKGEGDLCEMFVKEQDVFTNTKLLQVSKEPLRHDLDPLLMAL